MVWFPEGIWPIGVHAVLAVGVGIVSLVLGLVLVGSPGRGRALALFLLLTAAHAITDFPGILDVGEGTAYSLGQIWWTAYPLSLLAYIWFASDVVGWRPSWRNTTVATMAVLGFVMWFGRNDETYWFSDAIFHAFYILNILVAAALFASAMRVWLRSSGVARRNAGLYCLGVGLIEIGWVWVMAVITVGSILGGHADVAVKSIHIYLVLVMAVGWLAGLLVLTYALARYQILDLSLRVHSVIWRGAILVVFAGVFVAATALTELAFDRLGYVGGAVAAAALLLGLQPLQRTAKRLATAVSSDVPLADRPKDTRLTLYREQAAIAYGDGTVSNKELSMLDTMRERLGLSHKQAAEIHKEFW